MKTKKYECQTCDQTEENTTDTPSECSWCQTGMKLIGEYESGMSVEEARSYLADISPDRFFGFPEGTIAKMQGIPKLK